MKTIKELLAFIALICSTTLWAYDFSAENDDGVTIYYNITSSSERTCEVTYLYYYSSSNNEAYSGEVSIPETATYNGIMYTVTAIGRYAFYNCLGLMQVTIPNSVKTISSDAFYYCTGLTEITIPNSVTYLSGFRSCTGLKSITIGNSVTTIGSCAFYQCQSLTEITIPNSVTTIGNSAFDGCTGLTGTLTIPESVTSIGEWAFALCRGLMQITIGNSVTTIGDRAFYKCTGVTQFEVAGDNEYYCAVNGVLFTKDMTTLIQFPAASSMTSYTIPNSVTKIDTSAFDECRGLTSATIPESVITIGKSAFCDCSGLTEVSIPNSVTEIGDDAFSGCTSVTELTIGNSVTKISDYAFHACWSLESIISLNPEPPACGSNVFDYVPTSTCVLYVPEGTLEAYSTAYAWKDFLNIIDNQPNAIDDIMTNGNAEAVGYYTTDGKQVPTLQRGINIVRYSDGTAKKVLVK